MTKKDSTVDFLDILIVIAKHKKFLITTVFAITILSLVISLVWPKTYLSNSEVIQTRESMGNLGGLLQSFGSISAGQNKIGAESMLVILNSQSMKEKVIEEFNLREIYGLETREELIEKLKEVIVIEEMREGGFGFNPILSIKINVEDKDPERAQAINQFILEELSYRMENLNEDSNEEVLSILEKRFLINEADLIEAETALNKFQETYGILEVSSQLSVMIENLASLKTSMIEKEIELQVLSNRLDENSSQIIQKREEQDAVSEAYYDLIRQTEDLGSVTDGFYSLFDLPDLLLEYTRLMREVETQNRIYELLLPQLEQRRLYLQNKSSGVRIVDQPDLPTYKHSPKRLYIVLGGFFFAIFISFIIILIKELFKSEDSIYKDKILELKREII